MTKYHLHVWILAFLVSTNFGFSQDTLPALQNYNSKKNCLVTDHIDEIEERVLESLKSQFLDWETQDQTVNRWKVTHDFEVTVTNESALVLSNTETLHQQRVNHLFYGPKLEIQGSKTVYYRKLRFSSIRVNALDRLGMSEVPMQFTWKMTLGCEQKEADFSRPCLQSVVFQIVLLSKKNSNVCTFRLLPTTLSHQPGRTNDSIPTQNINQLVWFRMFGTSEQYYEKEPIKLEPVVNQLNAELTFESEN